jgi:hypothetical protein
MRAPHDTDVWTAVMIGRHAWTRAGFLEGILRPPWQWREERQARDEAWKALEEVGLADRASDPADALPLGQLRLLAVARALAQRPRVLLLDEPAAGRAAEKARRMKPFRRPTERGLPQILMANGRPPGGPPFGPPAPAMRPLARSRRCRSPSPLFRCSRRCARPPGGNSRAVASFAFTSATTVESD